MFARRKWALSYAVLAAASLPKELPDVRTWNRSARENAASGSLDNEDSDQLERAFTNILSNGAQATDGPGTITIRSWFDLVQQTAAASFVDTGPGISPENLGHIFEPFFTTKPEGRGTGLGLAIAHAIVERHGGTIEADSKPGVGTMFTVRLPERSTT